MTPLPWFRRTLIILLLAAICTGAIGQEAGLYRSNDRFLAIEEIRESERGRYTYVLELESSGRRLERRLFREGELFRRQVETRGADGMPRELRTLDQAGEILELQRYRYDPAGRLRSVTVTGGGERQDRFLTGSVGGRTDLTEDVLEERDQDETVRSVYRYDEAGRLILRRRYVEAELTEEVRREYGDGRLVTTVARYPRERRSVVGSYDERGNLVLEEVYEAERLTSRHRWFYGDANRLQREVIEARETREIRYEYDSAGELLLQEEFLGGTLLELVEFEGDRRVITRFRRGEPVLRTTFLEETRLREEVIHQGEVVEVREFGEE